MNAITIVSLLGMGMVGFLLGDSVGRRMEAKGWARLFDRQMKLIERIAERLDSTDSKLTDVQKEVTHLHRSHHFVDE